MQIEVTVEGGEDTLWLLVLYIVRAPASILLEIKVYL